jgi:glutamate racemase
MQNQSVGVFDSGVGGLSVLSEIQKLLPTESSIFIADQAYIPYGGKTKEELIDRVSRIMNFFQEKEVKAVVAACNTATVYTIDEMRKRFEFPIIGTVPVIKTIAGITKTGKTAVFSTPATAKSPYLQKLIDTFAKGITVEKIGGSNLEELVEKGDVDSPEINAVLKKILPPLRERGIDAIALGCTHYPFLKQKIQDIMGEDVAIVDSGGAVARRLKEVLTHENLLSLQKETDRYYTTGDVSLFEKAATKLTGNKIQAQRITL